VEKGDGEKGVASGLRAKHEEEEEGTSAVGLRVEDRGEGAIDLATFLTSRTQIAHQIVPI
jgi:hypothetical protein